MHMHVHVHHVIRFNDVRRLTALKLHNMHTEGGLGNESSQSYTDWGSSDITYV